MQLILEIARQAAHGQPVAVFFCVTAALILAASLHSFLSTR